MSKKETEKPAEETQVDENIEGTGLTDPSEIGKMFGLEPAKGKETEAKEPPETEGPKDDDADDEDDESDDDDKDDDEADETDDDDDADKDDDDKDDEDDEKDPEELTKLKAEAEDWKKKFTDSAREVQTKFLPMAEKFDALQEKAAKAEALAEERAEIAEVLQSNPELLAAFVAAAKNPKLAEKPKTEVDQDAINAAIKATLGEDGLRTINELKQKKVADRVAAIDKFEENHPGLTDEDRYKVAQMAGSIEAINKVGLDEALENAFTALWPDKAFEKKGKAMVEQEKIRAIKNKNGTVSKVSSGKSENKTTQLTPQERVVARKLNMSEEDYIKYKVK